MKSRLEELYKSKIRTELKEKLNLKNIMEVPRLSKIVINMGVKEAVGDSKILNNVKGVLELIAGQAVIKTKAKKSVAGFKLREGMPIGASVILRGKSMYNFLDKLINLALPSVRDFQGLSTKFDGRGNYNLGLKDWMIFPEVNYDTVDKVRGMNITITTTADSDVKGLALLKSFKMPFKVLKVAKS